MTRARSAWPVLAALTALCHLLGLFCLRGFAENPGRALQRQLLFWLLAGFFWLAMLFALHRRPIKEPAASDVDEARKPQRSRRALIYIGLLGLLMRLPALALPLVHSEDVYRYLWDGAAKRAHLDPYAGSPEAPIYEDLRATHGELYAHINHRYLPTIYPPMAQLIFLVGARLVAERGDGVAARLWRWKALAGGCELLLGLLLLAVLRRSGDDPRWLSLWLLCPLPAIEIWLNGHQDAFALLLVGAALLLFQPGLSAVRAAALGAFLALSALIKPLAVVVLPGLRGLKGTALLALGLGALLAALLAWYPYRAASLQVAPSLGEYGRRWRSNDGAYAVFHLAATKCVDDAYKPPYYEPWQSKKLARLITGRDRDTVWPDELANFVTRAFCAALLLGLLAIGLRRRLPPIHIGLLLLCGYALLTPTLHPWYLLWPLLLAPLWRAAAPPILWLVALAPLAYLPLPAEWAGAGHHEAVWARALQHGGAWIAVGWMVICDALRRAKLLPEQAQKV